MPHDYARLDLFESNVTRRIVVYDFRLRERPGIFARLKFRVRGQKSRGDVVGGILLQYFDIIKDLGIGFETLNKPGARIAPVAENLSFGAGGTSFRKEKFSRHLSMWRHGIIERETDRRCKNREEEKRREH